MSGKMEKRVAWILKRFSSLQDEISYSRPFVVAGCYWRLLAYSKGDRNGYLSLYLELADPASLPSEWRREVKFRLTLVNQIRKQSTKVLEGQHWFDASDSRWGFKEFLPLYKLYARGNGFLVSNKLIIVAEVEILPAIVVPEETLKITEPLSIEEGNGADDASEECSDASEEDPDDDDDDDASSPVSNICPLNQPNAWKNASHSVGNRGMSCDNVAVSNADTDDAPKEDPADDDDDASSPVSYGGRDICPLNQLNAWKNASHAAGICGMSFDNVAVSNADNDDAPKEDPDDDGMVEKVQVDASFLVLKSFEDVSQTVENGGRGCNSMTSVADFKYYAQRDSTSK